MRVLTLNVCGIRASEKKGLFAWLKKQKSDYVCLQEVRAQENQIDDEKYSLNGYDRYMSVCLLYTSPSPRDATLSRMPSSA